MNYKISCIASAITAATLLLIHTLAFAQDTNIEKNKEGKVIKARKHKKLPSWVKMMDDPHVNYYKAVQSFNKYWRNREEPREEGEQYEGERDSEEREEIEGKKREGHRKKSAPSGMYYYYNKFKRWKRLTEPYVKSDGTLYTAEERKALWRKQIQERSINR